MLRRVLTVKSEAVQTNTQIQKWFLCSYTKARINIDVVVILEITLQSLPLKHQNQHTQGLPLHQAYPTLPNMY